MNKPGVIFLDVDGVLNYGFAISPKAPRGQLSSFVHPPLIQRLNLIVAATDAVVVVSSTWRAGKSGIQLGRDFAGIGYAGRVVGRTDVLSCDQHQPLKCAEAHRGMEIASWLEEHPVVDSFVILDDDSDMGPLWPWLVHVNGRLGLSDANVNDAIKMLTSGPDPIDLAIAVGDVVDSEDVDEGLQATGDEGVPDQDVLPGGGLPEGEGDSRPEDATDLPAGDPSLAGGVGGGANWKS